MYSQTFDPNLDLLQDTQVTGEDGTYWLGCAVAGTYFVEEELPGDWVRTAGPDFYNRNKDGQLTNITDPLGRSTGFIYNTKGELQKIRFPDDTQIEYRYDPDFSFARIEWITDQSGDSTRYVYNTLAQLTNVLGTGVNAVLQYDGRDGPREQRAGRPEPLRELQV